MKKLVLIISILFLSIGATAQKRLSKQLSLKAAGGVNIVGGVNPVVSIGADIFLSNNGNLFTEVTYLQEKIKTQYEGIESISNIVTLSFYYGHNFFSSRWMMINLNAGLFVGGVFYQDNSFFIADSNRVTSGISLSPIVEFPMGRKFGAYLECNVRWDAIRTNLFRFYPKVGVNMYL